MPRLIKSIICLLLISQFSINLNAQAPCSGVPYVEQNSFESTRLIPCFTTPETGFEDFDVAIQGDWAAFGVAAEGGPGAVYLYHFDGTDWQLHTRLAPFGLVLGDKFGAYLKLRNNKLLIGSPGAFSSSGRAYLYAFDGTTWNQEAVFTSDPAYFNQRFGQGLEIMETSAGFDLIYVGGSQQVRVFKVDAAFNTIGSGTIRKPFASKGFGMEIIAKGDWMYVLGKKGYVYKFDGTRYNYFQEFGRSKDDASSIAFDGESIFIEKRPRFVAQRGEVIQRDFDGTSWEIEETYSPPSAYAACDYTGGGGKFGLEIEAGDNNLFIYSTDRRFMHDNAGVIFWYQRPDPSSAYEIKATYSNPDISINSRIGEKMDYDNGRLILGGFSSGNPQAYIVELDKVCTPPSGLTANPVSGGVNLSWDVVPDANLYRVRIKDCNSSSTPADDVLIETKTTTATSVFIPLAPGSYEWDIKTDCSANTSERFGLFDRAFTAFSIRESEDIAFANAQLNESISVVPNPATGVTHISSKQPLTRIGLVDIAGRIVAADFRMISNQSFQLDVTDLPPGLYFILGEGENFSHRSKLMVR